MDQEVVRFLLYHYKYNSIDKNMQIIFDMYRNIAFNY